VQSIENIHREEVEENDENMQAQEEEEENDENMNLD